MSKKLQVKLLAESFDALVNDNDIAKATRLMKRHLDMVAQEQYQLLESEDEDFEVTDMGDDFNNEVAAEAGSDEDERFEQVQIAIDELEDKFPAEMSEDVESKFDELRNIVDELKLADEGDEVSAEDANVIIEDLKADFEMAGEISDEVNDLFDEISSGIQGDADVEEIDVEDDDSEFDVDVEDEDEEIEESLRASNASQLNEFFKFDLKGDENMSELESLVYKMKSIKPLLLGLKNYFKKSNNMDEFANLLTRTAHKLSPNSEFACANINDCIKGIISLNKDKQWDIAQALCDLLEANSSTAEYHDICKEVEGCSSSKLLDEADDTDVDLAVEDAEVDGEDVDADFEDDMAEDVDDGDLVYDIKSDAEELLAKIEELEAQEGGDKIEEGFEKIADPRKKLSSESEGVEKKRTMNFGKLSGMTLKKGSDLMNGKASKGTEPSKSTKTQPIAKEQNAKNWKKTEKPANKPASSKSMLGN